MAERAISQTITVTDALTEVLNIEVKNGKVAFIEIANAASPANALDQFEVRYSADGVNYVTMRSAYSTVAGILADVVGNPAALAAGAQAALVLDIIGVNRVSLWAASASAAGSQVTARASIDR